jgi:hypothetical protein
MKTLRLTKLESAAYTNGERRFWRAMRKQPERTMVAVFVPQPTPEPFWNVGGFRLRANHPNPYRCPYGKPGDRIIVNFGPVVFENLPITAITVEQRGGKWGWLLEVGA